MWSLEDIPFEGFQAISAKRSVAQGWGVFVAETTVACIRLGAPCESCSVTVMYWVKIKPHVGRIGGRHRMVDRRSDKIDQET